MNSITTGDNYWSNMAILAHEVGHHINGHTLSGDLSQYESRLEELEADEFAGFVLSKLGADIEVVKNVFDEISFDGDDTYSSHPNRTRRLNAIERGMKKQETMEILHKLSFLLLMNIFIEEKKILIMVIILKD